MLPSLIFVLVMLLVVTSAPLVIGLFIWAFKKFNRNPISLEDAVVSVYEIAYPRKKI